RLAVPAGRLQRGEEPRIDALHLAQIPGQRYGVEDRIRRSRLGCGAVRRTLLEIQTRAIALKVERGRHVLVLPGLLRAAFRRRCRIKCLSSSPARAAAPKGKEL